MKFKKICIIDIEDLKNNPKFNFRDFSDNKPVYIDIIPSNTESLYGIIKDADCLLVNVSVSLPKEIFTVCKQLKYVGIYARALSRIDLKSAAENNVTVKNISNWCDWETAEFVFGTILHTYRAMGNKKWKTAPRTLKNRQLGIVGLGEVGFQVAKFAKAFGMELVYFSRKKKIEAEQLGIKYLPLDQLFKTSDVISLHLPPDSRLIGKKEMELTKEESLIVNSSVGETIDKNALKKWLQNKKHFAVFDKISGENVMELADYPNIEIFNIDAYLTDEVKQRRIEKLINNVKAYLNTIS